MSNEKICFNCIHWNGDRELQLEKAAQVKDFLKWTDGFNVKGSCDEDWRIIDIYNAKPQYNTEPIKVGFDANFGCKYFKPCERWTQE